MSLCAFGTFIVIGQSLTPVEFGLFALASSISVLPVSLVGAGFYERTMTGGDDSHEWQTAYWCTAIMGAIGCAAIVALASIIHLHAPDSGLVPLLIPLSLWSLLWGLSAIHEAVLIGGGKGARVAAVLITAETVGFLSLIAALAWGLGITSLVLARLTNALATWIGYAAAASTPVPYGFARAKVQKMLSYSADIVASRLVGWVDSYGSDVVIAGVLSAGGLGIYRMGTRLFMAIGGVVIGAPGIAQIASAGNAAKRSGARLSVVTARYITLHAGLALPIFAGLAASAAAIVEIVLKPEWASAAGVTALISLSAPGSIVASATSAVLLARQESRRLLYFNTLAAFAGVLAIFIGAFGGPMGIAVAKSLIGMAFAVIILVLIRALDQAVVKKTLSSLLAILIACAAQVAVTTLLLTISGDGGSLLLRIFRLGAANLLGVFMYLVTLYLLAPRTFWLLWFVLVSVLLPSRKESSLQSRSAAEA
jgi:O-antigen/teichoic acid export membrane protein